MDINKLSAPVPRAGARHGEPCRCTWALRCPPPLDIHSTVLFIQAMERQTALESVIAGYGSVVVGFSGGVDSALVAVTSHRVLGGERALAVVGISPSLATDQARQAEEVAVRFGLRLERLATREFTDERYTANSPNRCYFCKHELWSSLVKLATDRGFARVADGTNADDRGGHRPGIRAGRALGIRSPLLEAGYTKDMIREEARRLEIPTWNAPSAPCLSSRIRYGLRVTEERVRQVERGERYLRDLGVSGDLRVRHRGDEARIEVAPDLFGRVRDCQQEIVAAFRELGFEQVSLDLRGYRSGSLLREADHAPEILTG